MESDEGVLVIRREPLGVHVAVGGVSDTQPCFCHSLFVSVAVGDERSGLSPDEVAVEDEVVGEGPGRVDVGGLLLVVVQIHEELRVGGAITGEGEGSQSAVQDVEPTRIT